MVGRLSAALAIVLRLSVSALAVSEIGAEGHEAWPLGDMRSELVMLAEDMPHDTTLPALQTRGKMARMDSLEDFVLASKALHTRIGKSLRGGPRELGEGTQGPDTAGGTDDPGPGPDDVSGDITTPSDPGGNATVAPPAAAAAAANDTANATTNVTHPTGPVADAACLEQQELLEQCKKSIQSSGTFLSRMQEEAAALTPEEDGKKGTSQMAMDLLIQTGEYGMDSLEAKPMWCTDILLILRDCHTQLYKVTAFLEHVGTGRNGSPRPGFPGSKVPPPHKDVSSKVINGSSNDPSITGPLEAGQIVAIEHICSRLQSQEVIQDDPSYTEDAVKKFNTDTMISEILANRAQWWTDERTQKTAAYFEPSDIPKCQGCWMRRRRASGTFGEVNSCPPIPPTPPPTPATPAPTEEPEPESSDDGPQAAPSPAPSSGAAEDNSDGTSSSSGDADGAATTATSGDASIPDGYDAPASVQNKFFHGVLRYIGGGAWACNTANSAMAMCSPSNGDLGCDTKGPGATALSCKAKCDACSSCVGFNFARIPYMDGVGEGGLCVYLSKDPQTVNVGASSQCAAYLPPASSTPAAPTPASVPSPQTGGNGEELVTNSEDFETLIQLKGDTFVPTCANPGSDAKFFCCAEGAYYHKSPPSPPVVCPACCTYPDVAAGVPDPNKCDGPTCQNCAGATPSPAAPPGCQPTAKACCASDCGTHSNCVAPCDDASCTGCQQVPAGPADADAAAREKTETGSNYKFNMKQATALPKAFDHYTNPPELQGKFYYGAVPYPTTGAGGIASATCNPALTTGSGEPNSAIKSCMAVMSTTSNVEACATYCDADPQCKGFNYVYNPYSTNTWTGPSGSYDVARTPKWMSAPVKNDGQNNGGLCVFLSQAPTATAPQNKACGDWQGPNNICLEPYNDKQWYCCRAAYYYHKTYHQNGNATDGSSNVHQGLAAAHAAANGACMAKPNAPNAFCKWSTSSNSCAANGAATDGNCAKQTDSTTCNDAVDDYDQTCKFPFVWNGKTYNKCATQSGSFQLADGSWTARTPWCATSLKDAVDSTGTNVDAYGRCFNSCPTVCTASEKKYQGSTVVQTLHGFECNFPFTYNNVQHTSCTNQDHSAAWCATGVPCVWKNNACTPQWNDGVAGNACTAVTTQAECAITHKNAVTGSQALWGECGSDCSASSSTSGGSSSGTGGEEDEVEELSLLE